LKEPTFCPAIEPDCRTISHHRVHGFLRPHVWFFDYHLTILSPLTRLLFLLSVVLLPACELVGPGDPGAVTVFNNSAGVIVVTGVEVELSHRLDIVPRLKLATLPDGAYVILVGSRVVIKYEHVMGYHPGDDIRLFIYFALEEEAVYSWLVTVTHENLERNDFQVIVKDPMDCLR